MRAEFMPKEQNHTYEKLYYTLWELAGRYSGFCQFRAVGNSHDDRLIPMLEVGNGAQMIFCVAGIRLAAGRILRGEKIAGQDPDLFSSPSESGWI